MSTEKTLLENGNEPSCLGAVMRFYFKVNNSKLQDKNKLKNQIEKVIQRLVLRNNIESKFIDLYFGTVEDDFIYDRCRLRISFNCV